MRGHQFSKMVSKFPKVASNFFQKWLVTSSTFYGPDFRGFLKTRPSLRHYTVGNDNDPGPQKSLDAFVNLEAKQAQSPTLESV